MSECFSLCYHPVSKCLALIPEPGRVNSKHLSTDLVWSEGPCLVGGTWFGGREAGGRDEGEAKRWEPAGRHLGKPEYSAETFRPAPPWTCPPGDSLPLTASAVSAADTDGLKNKAGGLLP